MNASLKYINYYKKGLEHAYLEGLRFTPDYSLVLETPNGIGTLITPMFDTSETECSFNRLVIEGDFSGCKLEVIVSATDDLYVMAGGQAISLQTLLGDAEISAQDKATLLQELSHIRAVGAQDMLLHQVSGRYVWVMLRVFPLEASSCQLEGLRLEFPKVSFTKYFPEIYQGNPFFERYIGVFQSVLLDIERDVQSLPQKLDYESTDDDTLAELASWLGLENDEHVFSTAQLRHMIANIDLFQGGKGTRTALEQVIALVCGIKPKIVEQFRWDSDQMTSYRRETHRRLYGASGNHFCVILDLSQEGASLPVTKAQIENLITSYTMLGTSFQLVFLQKASHCDTHCYLDINSRLSVPEVAAVDGVTLGAHITVG